MKHSIRFTQRAQADLAAVYDYLIQHTSATTAQTFVDKIYHYCCSLDLFPERGVKRDDIRQGLRIVGYQRHASIAFAIVGQEVIILRIFMRGQDANEDLE